nr:uncharacterized protein LOC106732414 [Pelodiscus sinensis]XP_025043439.1 uncharacterized protein LOC106732414 [Pelodiscus sinensis]XP_025043440.1 uncharacterized protein LOC106732414 [Pelodiscus sinensis]|eukprot:XP_014431927.1 uncharacterized protein LOC106732414 [Pelodiscus sinensis]
MVSPWFQQAELACSSPVKNVLLHSRKKSTRIAYLHKWKRFSSWCANTGDSLASAPIHLILDYLMHLKDSSLSLASIRVHVAAVTAFYHPVQGYLLFSHPMTKRFMKGITNLFPHHTRPADPWDLELVLSTLTTLPFEPLAMCDLHTLSMKVIFLLAITSSRRVSELVALSASFPYTVFTPQGVILCPQLRFLPKVNSQFHINKPIVLPVFHPKPHCSAEQARLHTLDVRHALAFYIQRTKPLRRSRTLLVSMAEHSKACLLSAQCISSIIVECVRKCYIFQSKPFPTTTRAHSTRAVTASTAFLKGVSLKDVCRTATWSSDFTFAKYYAMPNLLIPDATVASAVLSTAAPR